MVPIDSGFSGCLVGKNALRRVPGDRGGIERGRGRTERRPIKS